MSRSLRTFKVAAAAATIALVVAACEPDRAITTSPDDDPAFGIGQILTATNLPRGTARFPFPCPIPCDTVNPDAIGTELASDSLIVTLAGLDSLVGASYVIWFSNDDGSTIGKGVGQLTIVRTDTIINELGDPEPDPHTFVFTNASSFSNGGPRQSMTFVTSRAAMGLSATDEITRAFVSIEKDPGVSQPSSTRRPLGVYKTDDEGDATTNLHVDSLGNVTADRHFVVQDLFFGDFEYDPSEAYEFPLIGSGRVFVRGNVLQFNDSTLARPPLGYYYAAWVFKRDAESNAITDTVYLGPLTAPFPNRDQSLRNADSLLVAPSVQFVGVPPTAAGDWSNASPDGIIAATVRVGADTMPVFNGGIEPFVGVSDALISLAPKDGEEGRLGTAIYFQVALPGIIRFGSQ